MEHERTQRSAKSSAPGAPASGQPQRRRPSTQPIPVVAVLPISEVGTSSEHGRIQAKSEAREIGADGGLLDTDTDAAIERSRSGGRPLAEPVRRSMEGAFGADFSSVRVHSDTNAASLSSRIQARAFTTGSDVFFGAGQFQPATRSGQTLLAHELTHVVQQQPGRAQRSMEGGRNVIRRWAVTSLSQEKKSSVLEKIPGGTGLIKNILLGELAAMTASVDELEKLLERTDADTLKSILADVCPAADKNKPAAQQYGGWVTAVLNLGVSPELCRDVVAAAQDKVAKPSAIWNLLKKYHEPDVLTLVNATRSASMVNEMFATLKAATEVATLIEYLQLASPGVVLAVCKGRKGDETMLSLRSKIIEDNATDKGITAGNGTFIKFYEVANLPVPAPELVYIINALEVFDGNAGPLNTWRGQTNSDHGNKQANLPGVKNAGGYQEHDIESPGEGGAGTRRLVTDNNTNAVYYTNTHYGDRGSPAFYLIRRP